MKVFSQVFFKKLAGGGARSPLIVPKNAGRGEFLCKAKKEGEPSSGVRPLLPLFNCESKYSHNTLMLNKLPQSMYLQGLPKKSL